MPFSQQNSLPVSDVEPAITNMEGEKLIHKRFDTMYKLNPRDISITLTKLLIKHAKFTQNETEIGA